MKKMLRFAILAAWLVCSHFSAAAQGWIHPLDNDLYYIADIAEAPGVGVYTLSFLVNANHESGPAVVLKHDEAGNLLWRKDFPDLRPVFSMESDENGEVTVMTGRISADSLQELSYRLVHLNGDGDLTWETTLPMAFFGGTFTRSPNDGYLLSGIIGDYVQNTGFEWGIMKVDNMGGLLWQHVYDTITYDAGGGSNPSVAVNNTGDIFFYYDKDSSALNSDKARILSANGDLLWEHTYASSELTGLNVSAVGSDFMVTGYVGNGSGIQMRRMDRNGQVLWSQPISQDFYHNYPQDAFTDASGNYVLSGFRSFDALSHSKTLRVDVYSPDGSLLKQISRNLPGYGDYSIWNATFRPDGQNGYYVSGILTDFAGNWIIRYLLRMDENGLIYENYILGDVREDLNADCADDSTDAPVMGQKLRYYTFSNGLELFSMTDTSGNYVIETAPGTVNVELISPNNYWQACPQSAVETIQQGDTVGLNFHLLPVVQCPFLEVEIGAAYLRRCFSNMYAVRYCNSGTTDANNAYIDVKLDPAMTFEGSLMPSVALPNNVYRFDLGTVQRGASDVFYYWVNLSCDSTVAGETHCVEAHIYPDSTCVLDPQWSKASVGLSGLCAGDSVHFIIRNIGDGNMAAPLNYIVIEDNIIYRMGNFQLNQGEEMLVAVPANGSTWRMEAQQEPFHPGNSQPSVSIEGCGLDSLGNYTFGYISLFGEDDGDPFVSIDCQINVGSFDPNAILAMPEGVGDEHIIRQGQALDYKILFQNTGTFAADKVVIRDTLPFFMDPATFSMGVSSHPCQFDLSGAGILTFTFDNIALPDSNTNEPASHGFVQFHVAPKAWLSDGMVIENRAGIYFDFNEPIITNTVARKIGQLDHVVVSGTSIASGSDGLDMSPNPAIDLVNIYLPSAMGVSGEASLHDSFGKVVQVQSFSGNVLTINRKGAASGVYYLTLKCDNGKVLLGKIVWR